VQFPSDTNKILEQIQQIENLLEPNAIVAPCHNDLLPANILLNQQLYFIDWEYAGNGNQLFDLANLAANLELTDTTHLLEFYYGQINPQTQHELNLMRCVSDAREAFWGFLQSGISSLEFDFTKYANTHLERFRQAMAK
jgi:thiamine kinase-like enzyme